MPQSDQSGSSTGNGDDSQRLRPADVYKTIQEEGEEELSRPFSALWWSGIAAGFGISMSVVSKALFSKYLPDADWAPLVTNFGYCVGFLIVILGRMQLFTENTITAVMPVVADFCLKSVRGLARLWVIVFAANLVGTFIFALAALFAGIFKPDQIAAIIEVSHHLDHMTPVELIVRGIPAGFLVAALVWMLPSAQGQKFIVIVMMTYLIALGGFAHVVAGSAEVFVLMLNGDLGVFHTLFAIILPTFLGNVIGGTVLFTLLAYAQVKEEL